VRLLLAAFPLVGVVVFGWDAQVIITYFWAQNVAILLTEPFFMYVAFNRRIAAGLPAIDESHLKPNSQRVDAPPQVMMWILLAFFPIHFGGFALGQGFFLAVLGLLSLSSVLLAIVWQTLRRLIVDRRDAMALLEGGSIGHQYERVLPLQVAIIAGGWVVTTTNAGTVAVAALCLVGAWLEVRPPKLRRRSRLGTRQ
jgi:hypothetical protein